jgi:hypothetical protein
MIIEFLECDNWDKILQIQFCKRIFDISNEILSVGTKISLIKYQLGSSFHIIESSKGWVEFFSN